MLVRSGPVPQLVQKSLPLLPAEWVNMVKDVNTALAQEEKAHTVLAMEATARETVVASVAPTAKAAAE